MHAGSDDLTAAGVDAGDGNGMILLATDGPPSSFRATVVGFRTVATAGVGFLATVGFGAGADCG